MFRKTFSQKVARLFEVVGYLTLIPTFISLIIPLLILVASLLSFQFTTFFLYLIPFIIVGLGITLFVGYCKHSRGLLDEEKILPLWVGTFFFNAILFVLGVYYLLAFIKQTIEFDESLLSFSFVLFNAVVGWWLAVLSLSASAAVSEFNAN